MRGTRSVKTASATGAPGKRRAVMVSSVEEVSRAGEVERDSGGAARLDRLVVAHRAARLHDGANTGVDEHARPIGEGEEGIARCDCALGAVAGAGHSEPAGVDAVDLAHPDTDRGLVVGEQYRVRFHRPARAPCELEVAP